MVWARTAAARAADGLKKIGEGGEQMSAEGRRLESGGALHVEPEAESTEADATSDNDSEAVKAAAAGDGTVRFTVRAADGAPIGGHTVVAARPTADRRWDHVNRPWGHAIGY